MKHNFWRGVICGVVLGFIITAMVAESRADTISITPSPFAIYRNGILQSTDAEFVNQGEATYGGQRAQGVFTLNGRWVYWSAIEGVPCSCRPGWQFDMYYTDNIEPVGWIAPQNAQVLYTQVGEFLILDGQPIRTHAGDWNGDGTTTVQDIFDFLTAWFAGDTSIGPVEFLEGWYS